MAIVVTIGLLLAVAVFDLALGFYNSTVILQGARDGARAAMDCSKTASQIQAAALAVTPSGASVTVAPNPRPTCPANKSSDSTTTVTVTYSHQWITPIWSGGGSVTMSETATSR